ncbi:unnamed protein product [Adineta ricciae]|uniref:G-protein coupled receptors family 1 profile domain-containing protein n=1 Tax=Adineta ricciae TaxID=249248 RepID=A0A814VSM3_ADIRI|nr:unnamed protein product [Adineta ricciae]
MERPWESESVTLVTGIDESDCYEQSSYSAMLNIWEPVSPTEFRNCFGLIPESHVYCWSHWTYIEYLSSAVAGYFIIFGILPVRLLQFGYNWSLFIPSEILCKTLTFLFSWFRILPCWFIALASLDRYLCSSSSVTLRRWSTLPVSSCLIFCVTVFIGITQIPILIFYTIHQDPMICLGQPNSFQKLNGIFLLIIWSLIPSLAMLIFGLLTIRNIQKSAQRAFDHDMINRRQKRIKHVDRQLVQITLVQSILFGTTSAAGAIGGMYNVIDSNLRKDPLSLAVQGLTGNVLSFIGLLSPCMSFYLCTLSSQLFRRELVHLLSYRNR